MSKITVRHDGAGFLVAEGRDEIREEDGVTVVRTARRISNFGGYGVEEMLRDISNETGQSIPRPVRLEICDPCEGWYSVECRSGFREPW